MSSLVTVADCSLGRGLFAAVDLSAGTEILTFSGPLLTLSQVRALGPQQAPNALQLGIDRYLYLDAPGRFANHSCRPNAGVFDDVRLVALDAISAGTEIRFDYSTTIGDGWTMPCRCAAADCRGIVAAWALLPDRPRLWYSIRGCLQRFLWEQWEA